MLPKRQGLAPIAVSYIRERSHRKVGGNFDVGIVWPSLAVWNTLFKEPEDLVNEYRFWVGLPLIGKMALHNVVPVGPR